MEVSRRLGSNLPALTHRYYQSLLDFSRDFDVALMDKVVTTFYTGVGQEVCRTTRFFPSYHLSDRDSNSNKLPNKSSLKWKNTQMPGREYRMSWSALLFPSPRCDSFYQFAYIGTSISLVHRPANP